MVLYSCGLGVSTLLWFWKLTDGFMDVNAGLFFIPCEESCFGDTTTGAFSFQILFPLFVVTVLSLPGTLGVNRFCFRTENLQVYIPNVKNTVCPLLCSPPRHQKTCTKFPETSGLGAVRLKRANKSSRNARYIPNESGCRYWETFFPLQGSRSLPILKAGVNWKGRSTRIHLLTACSKPNGFLNLQNRLDFVNLTNTVEQIRPSVGDVQEKPSLLNEFHHVFEGLGCVVNLLFQ